MAVKTKERKEIERVFYKYSEYYGGLLNRGSSLNDTQRLNLIENFEMGYIIAEYFYFHKSTILETDIIFVAVKNSLNNLEHVHQKYNQNKK